MAEITAQLVKQLRDKTSAGMMDCQRALKETNGDLDAAVDLLRKKGITGAVNRAGREAKEGGVQALVSADGTTAAVVELNCETDFVAKNDGFKSFLSGLVSHALGSAAADSGNAADFLAGPGNDGSATLDETVKVRAASMGENLVLRRVQRLIAGPNGLLVHYVHLGGRVAVVVEVATGKAETRSHEAVTSLAKDLCFQVCAANPEYVRREDVPAAIVDKEMEIQKDRMKEQLATKPENIVAKILEGSVSKFYSGICLLEQAFVKDDKQTVEQLVAATGKAVGDEIRVVRIARLALGESVSA